VVEEFVSLEKTEPAEVKVVESKAGNTDEKIVWSNAFLLVELASISFIVDCLVVVGGIVVIVNLAVVVWLENRVGRAELLKST